MTFAIILFSGNSKRLSDYDVPKQFIKLNNKPIFTYPVDVFLNNKEINKIILVCSNKWIDYVNEYLQSNYDECNLNNIDLISGGDCRNESLLNAFNFIKQKYPLINPDDFIITHDGVRIFVDDEIIHDNILKLNQNTSSVVNTAVECSDSLCKIDSNKNTFSIDRECVFKSQTPQSSTFKIFSKIYSRKDYDKKIFDNCDYCKLAEINQIKIVLSKGKNSNFKITNKDDLELAKKLI